MRTEMSVSRDGQRYAVRLTKPQRAALISVLGFVRDHFGSDALTLQLGCSSEFLVDVCQRVHRNEVRDWSIDQLHVIYGAMSSIGIHFVSEEDFYIRMGFFREHARDMARSMIRAISSGSPQ
jgi:hypothetical protein